MATFDFRTVEDNELRGMFQRMLHVSGVAGSAVRSAYGSNKRPISTVFVDDGIFNASVGLARSRYLIKISASVPILTRILFDRFFQNEAVMPWLERSGEDAAKHRYDVKFILDPKEFNERENWQIAMTPERSFAAGAFTDICLAFIALHEIGHVIAGHSEAVQHYYGVAEFSELFENRERSTQDMERDQSWEYDADAVAIGLFVQYVEELVANRLTNERTARFFESDGDPVSQALSFVVTALFVMFNYVRGSRYDLDLATSHPHPMVRGSIPKGHARA